VTRRIRSLSINGQTVHQAAVAWNWGYMGLSQGDSGNELTPRVCDSNSMIPEFRAFLCDIHKA